MAHTRRGDEQPRLFALSWTRAPLRLGVFGRRSSRVGGADQGVARGRTRRLRLLQQRRDGLRAEERRPPARAGVRLTASDETFDLTARGAPSRTALAERLLVQLFPPACAVEGRGDRGGGGHPAGDRDCRQDTS